MGKCNMNNNKNNVSCGTVQATSKPIILPPHLDSISFREIRTLFHVEQSMLH